MKLLHASPRRPRFSSLLFTVATLACIVAVVLGSTLATAKADNSSPELLAPPDPVVGPFAEFTVLNSSCTENANDKCTCKAVSQQITCHLVFEMGEWACNSTDGKVCP